MTKKKKENNNLLLFPENSLPKRKAKKSTPLTKLKFNFSNSGFLFGGPTHETSELIWQKSWGEYDYYLEGSKQAGGLPYGTYYRLLQIYIDTQIMLSKKGRKGSDIKFRNIGGSKSPYIEFDDSMTGIAKVLGISPTGRNLKKLAIQFERFTSVKIILTYKDPETGEFIREKKSIFPGVLEIWSDETKKVLKKSRFTIDLAYYHHVCKHGQPLIPEVVEKLRKSSSYLDFYRFVSYRYNSGFKHSINLDDIASFFEISTSKISQYFTNVLEKTILPLYEESTGDPMYVRIEKGKNRFDPAKIIFTPGKRLKP